MSEPTPSAARYPALGDRIQATSPAELRAEIARRWILPRYILACNAGTHPNILSQMLRGTLPLNDTLVKKLRVVMQLEEVRRAQDASRKAEGTAP